MKTTKLIMLCTVLIAVFAIAFTSCKKENKSGNDTSSIEQMVQDENRMALADDETMDDVNTVLSRNGNCNANSYLLNCINSLPFEALSTSEINALNTMREEELFAHDVYVKLYSIYNIRVFNNISLSETQHAEAVKSLLLKYNLPDPALNHVAGVFVDPDLQVLYTSLIAQGSASLNAGLLVGATIEDLDINDLHNHITTDVDNQDILFVFNNLEKGSRNHLRSFYKLIIAKGLTYTPQFISLVYFNQIISTPHETGSVPCPN